MLEVQSITSGTNSPNFEALKNLGYNQRLLPKCCCVINVGARSLSLIFMTLERQRDFLFLIGVELLLTRKKYSTLTKFVAEKVANDNNV